MNKRISDTMQRIIQFIKKGACSTSILLGRYIRKIYPHTLGVMISRFRKSTLLGRAFILVGLIASLTMIFLVSTYALDFSIKNNKYVLVAVDIANIREGTTTNAKIIEKVKRGERLTWKGETDDWWCVEKENWKKPGWISKKIAKLKNTKNLSMNYEMSGYGLLFLASLIVLYVGFCLKQA